MTLTKRKLSYATVYTHPEFLERSALDSSSSSTPHSSAHAESSQASHLKDVHVASLTGVLAQIGHLAAYATELLDGLFRIAQETTGRLESVGDRTQKLHQSLLAVEMLPPPPLSVDVLSIGTFAQKLEIKVPHIFTKQTNDDAILGHYYLCTPPPPLRKFDALLGGEQCMQSYSHPRFFFEQWFKSELKRQEAKKAEKKKKKMDRREKRDKTKNQEQKSQQKKKAVKRVTMQSWKQQIAGYTEPNGMPLQNVEVQNVPPPPPPQVKLIPKAVPPPPPPQAFKKRGSATDIVTINPPPPPGNPPPDKRASVRIAPPPPPPSSFPTQMPTTTANTTNTNGGEDDEQRNPLTTTQMHASADEQSSPNRVVRARTERAKTGGGDQRSRGRTEGPMPGTDGVGAEQANDGSDHSDHSGHQSVDDDPSSYEAGDQDRGIVDGTLEQRSKALSRAMSRSSAGPLSARFNRPLSGRPAPVSDSARPESGRLAARTMTRGMSRAAGPSVDSDGNVVEGGTDGIEEGGEGQTDGDDVYYDEAGGDDDPLRKDSAPYRESRYRSSGDESLLQDEDEAAPVDPLADPMFDKYRTMQKINLPEGAIRQKMERDSVDPDLVDLFCPNTTYERPKKAKAASVESLPDEEDDPDAPQGDPADWEETKDPSTGGMYFVNKSTWESSWVPPAGWKAYAKAQKEAQAAAKKGLSAPSIADGLKNAIMQGRELRRLSVTPGAHKFVDDRVEVLDGIKSGAVKLKKAAPLAPKKVDARQDIMSQIKQGTLKSALQHVEQNKFDATERMDAAVAQLLANRTAIAGNESDSDSDSDYDFDSDDDYP